MAHSIGDQTSPSRRRINEKMFRRLAEQLFGCRRASVLWLLDVDVEAPVLGSDEPVNIAIRRMPGNGLAKLTVSKDQVTSSSTEEERMWMSADFRITTWASLRS